MHVIYLNREEYWELELLDSKIKFSFITAFCFINNKGKITFSSKTVYKLCLSTENFIYSQS